MKVHIYIIYLYIKYIIGINAINENRLGENAYQGNLCYFGVREVFLYNVKFKQK